MIELEFLFYSVIILGCVLNSVFWFRNRKLQRILDSQLQQIQKIKEELQQQQSVINADLLALKQNEKSLNDTRDGLELLHMNIVEEKNLLQKERLEFQIEMHKLQFDQRNVSSEQKQDEDLKKEQVTRNETDIKFMEEEKQKYDLESSRLDTQQQSIKYSAVDVVDEMNLLEHLEDHLKIDQNGLQNLKQEKIEQEQNKEVIQSPNSLQKHFKLSQEEFSFPPDIIKEKKLESNIIEAGKHGGRPRKSEEISLDSKGEKERELQPRINILCKKNSWQWEIGIEIPDDLEFMENLCVLQAGEELNKVVQHKTLWFLKDIDVPVLIHWTEKDIPKCISIKADKKQLLFKLTDDQENGHLVKTISIGSYAVFVPEKWVRDDSISGSPTVDPENATLEGYKVHFFDFLYGDLGTVAFYSEDGKPISFSKKLQFELLGNRIPDISDNIGPLFGGSIPMIQMTTLKSLIQITTIVIGEEGSGTKKWRTTLPYNQHSDLQQLPVELSTKGANWYFVRFYNSNNEFIDSFDFRYIPELQSVRVQHNVETAIESTSEIEFIFDGACTILPKDKFISIEENIISDGKTIARFYCNSIGQDTSHWVVEGHENSVEITIDLSRLCWNLGDESTIPEKWNHKPVYLKRDIFKPTTSSCLYISLPRSHQNNHLLIGFRKENAQKFRVLSREKIIKISLRNFSDAREIELLNSAILNVWLNKTSDFASDIDSHFVIATLPQVNTKYYCSIDQCDFQTENQNQLMHHWDQKHDVLHFLQHVDNYDEYLKHYSNILGMNLPRKIYHCSHCKDYVSADDSFSNSSDAIYKHLIDEHPGNTRSFRIVKSVDEIRNEVIDSLPTLYKCKYSDFYFEGMDSKAIWNHFLTSHEFDFVNTTRMEEPPPLVQVL